MLNEWSEFVGVPIVTTACGDTLGVVAGDRWLPATNLEPVEVERFGRVPNVCVVELASVLA